MMNEVKRSSFKVQKPLCCMHRSFGWILLVGLILAFFVTDVSAQNALSTANKPMFPFLVFGEMYAVGAPLHLIVCGDVDCNQQRYTVLDTTPNAYTGLYIDVQTPPDGKAFITYVVHYHPFIYEIRTLKCGNILCNQGNVIQSHAFVNYQLRTKVQFKPGTSLPAWVYHTGNTSYFVQCSNETCTQWTSNALGSTTTDKISNQWIFAADGTPMIAALDGDVIKCTDTVCSATTRIQTTSRRYNSTNVRIVQAPDGKPVISYMHAPDYFNSDFIVEKCLDPRCKKRVSNLIASWVNPVFSEFEHQLIIGSDGKPAFIFQHETQPIVDYVHCVSSDCRVRNAQTVDLTFGSKTGIHNTLMVGPDGFPLIAHHNKFDLFYAHCTDLDCTNVGPTTPTLRQGMGNHVAMTLV